jgi:hypothetical protein
MRTFVKVATGTSDEMKRFGGRCNVCLRIDAHDSPSMRREAKTIEFLIDKCTDGALIKLKTLIETYSARVDVSHGSNASPIQIRESSFVKASSS